MKKIYTSILMLSLTLISFAQIVPSGKGNPPFAERNSLNIPFNYNNNSNTAPYLSASSTALFTEDFESVVFPGFPSGWTTYTDGDGTSDLFLSGDASITNQGGYFPIPAHTKFAYTDDDLCNCDKSSDYLQMPVLNLSGAVNYGVKFAYVSDSEYGDVAYVEASTNGTTWAVISSLPQSSGAYNWQNANINLSSYTGQSAVYIRFRYDDNGAWGSGLAIDDVIVDELPGIEVEMVSGFITPMEYPIIPLSQVQSISFSGEIANAGGNSFTNANVEVNVNNGVYTSNAFSGTVNSGNNTTISLPGTFTPSTVGIFDAGFQVSLTGDTYLNNNRDSLVFVVSDSVMARETGGNNAASSGGLYLAQQFDVYNTDILTSVSLGLNQPVAGNVISVGIYTFSGGMPGTEIASTISYTITAADAAGIAFITVPLNANCGEFTIAPGSYALVLKEDIDSPNVLFSTDFFTPNSTSYSQDQGATWTSLTGIFDVSFVLRANFGTGWYRDNAEFNYSSTVFCDSGSDPTPTITGVAGGTFSATPSGLVIDPSTGTITLASSNLGTYTIKYLTNGTCPDSSTVNLTVTNAFDASFSYPANSYCEGTQINILPNFVSGNAGTFSVTPGGLSLNSTTGEVNVGLSNPDTYIITNTIAASGSCPSATYSDTVTIFATPNVVATSSPSNICEGSSATLMASNALTYLWSPSTGLSASTGATVTASPISTTTYIVNGTDINGCANNASVTLTVNSSPAVPTITIDSDGITLTSSFGISPGNQWNFNGVAIQGATAQTYTATQNGSYTVTVTNADSCFATSAPVTVNSVGINEMQLKSNKIQIYPNPNNGQFMVQLNQVQKDDYVLELRNIIGQMIYSESINVNGNFTKQINLSSRDKGVYYLTIKNSVSNVTQKVIIK